MGKSEMVPCQWANGQDLAPHPSWSQLQRPRRELRPVLGALGRTVVKTPGGGTKAQDSSGGGVGGPCGEAGPESRGLGGGRAEEGLWEGGTQSRGRGRSTRGPE